MCTRLHAHIHTQTLTHTRCCRCCSVCSGGLAHSDVFRSLPACMCTCECCVRVFVCTLIDLALLQGQFILTFQNIWPGSRQIGPSIDRGCVSWGYACVSACVCGRACSQRHMRHAVRGRQGTRPNKTDKSCKRTHTHDKTCSMQTMCLCVCMCACACVYVCACDTCVCARTHAHMHTRRHTHMHTRRRAHARPGLTQN